MAEFGNVLGLEAGGVNYGAAASDLFSGASNLFGSLASAQASTIASKQYAEAAQVTGEQTALAEKLQQIQLSQAQGTVKANVAGNGFQMSGSAGDVLRSNAQQGALSAGALQMQGNLQADSYTAQSKAAAATASGQKTSGILSAVGAIASIFL